jgi:hypothetical protein
VAEERQHFLYLRNPNHLFPRAAIIDCLREAKSFSSLPNDHDDWENKSSSLFAKDLDDTTVENKTAGKIEVRLQNRDG